MAKHLQCAIHVTRVADVAQPHCSPEFAHPLKRFGLKLLLNGILPHHLFAEGKMATAVMFLAVFPTVEHLFALAVLQDQFFSLAKIAVQGRPLLFEQLFSVDKDIVVLPVKFIHESRHRQFGRLAILKFTFSLPTDQVEGDILPEVQLQLVPERAGAVEPTHKGELFLLRQQDWHQQRVILCNQLHRCNVLCDQVPPDLEAAEGFKEKFPLGLSPVVVVFPRFQPGHEFGVVVDFAWPAVGDKAACLDRHVEQVQVEDGGRPVPAGLLEVLELPDPAIGDQIHRHSKYFPVLLRVEPRVLLLLAEPFGVDAVLGRVQQGVNLSHCCVLLVSVVLVHDPGEICDVVPAVLKLGPEQDHLFAALHLTELALCLLKEPLLEEGLYEEHPGLEGAGRVGERGQLAAQEVELCILEELSDVEHNRIMAKAGAKIKNLTSYIEQLYDSDMKTKVQGARKILELSISFDHLEVMLEESSILSTIIRTLKEEFQKSMELCSNLLCFIYLLAHYSQFHELLKEEQVGSTTLEIVEYHLNRFDIRFVEYLDLARTGSAQAEKELKRLNLLIYKQDKVFYVALCVLLALSEDFNTERKMMKAGVISLLVRMLQRNDFNLLEVALHFLRKMIVMTENKNKMIQSGLVEKLARFFGCGDPTLLTEALALYRTLAMDKKGREKMQNEGIVPHIIEVLNVPALRLHAINILYLVSTDADIRQIFAIYDCIKPLIALAVRFPEKYVGLELSALLINIAACKENAQTISEDVFKKVVDRAVRSQDPNMLKFVKNILEYGELPEHSEVMGLSVKEISKVLLKRNKTQFDEDVCFQLIGILAAVRLDEEWERLLPTELLDYIARQISAIGLCEDDTLFQIVMLVGNIARNERVAQALNQRDCFEGLLGLLIEKLEDPEYCVQTEYAILQFLKHGIGVEMVIEEPNIKEELLNQTESQFEGVRAVTDEILDILREYDIKLAEEAKLRKFEAHNQEWLISLEQLKLSGQLDMPQALSPYDQDVYLDSRMWDSDSDYDQ